MVSCSSLIALVITAFEVNSSYRQGIADIEEIHSELTLVHSEVLIQQIWALDEYAASVSIQGLQKLKAIDRVELVWHGHEMLSVGEELQSAEIETVYPLYKLRDSDEYLLGDLRLYSTLRELRLEMIALVGVRLFFNLLKTLVVSAVLLYFFHRIATVHLRAISKHADSLALGESYKPLVLDRKNCEGNDELQVLADAINGMGERLQEDYLRSENHQTDLEKLVREHTSHLEAANQRLMEKNRSG